MNVVITESVRQEGLEAAVRKVAELFPKVIARALRPRVRVIFEVLNDAQGQKWVLVALEYDGSRVTERDIFEPAALNDLEFMRERFEWLWGRALRMRLIQRGDEPIEDEEGLVVQVENR